MGFRILFFFPSLSRFHLGEPKLAFQMAGSGPGSMVWYKTYRIWPQGTWCESQPPTLTTVNWAQSLSRSKHSINRSPVSSPSSILFLYTWSCTSEEGDPSHLPKPPLTILSKARIHRAGLSAVCRTCQAGPCFKVAALPST